MKTYCYSALMIVKVDFTVEANSIEDADAMVDKQVETMNLEVVGDGVLTESDIEHFYLDKVID